MKTAFRPVPFARSASTLATAIAIALLGVPFDSHAQVTPANGAQRPGIDTAANGVGVVNIVAPSKAGVSHNQYNDFNVDQRGLILNNAANVSPTQLAGYVVGNPNLQSGQSARVILNEVVSTNRSALNGALEIAGNRAEVIVANPNGIQVNGATFINTSRATLTTGTPVFGGDGSLNAFRVSRGAIEIGGAGVDASLTDRLDIIARQVIANGKVWANQLNVIAGASQVERDSLATQAIAGEGAAPEVAIDVAALGGMYSNHIYLKTDGAHIGVRNAGELASAGGFELTSTGQLVLTGKATATGNLSAHVTVLDNSGTLAANGALNIVARDGMTSRGMLYGGSGVSLGTGGAFANSGKLYAAQGALGITAGTFANRASGDIYAAHGITLGATSIDNAGGIEAGQSLLLNASGTLTHSGKLGAAGDITLTATTLDSRGAVVAGNDLRVSADAIALGGQLQAGRDATIQARALNNDGVVHARRDLALSGGDVTNTAKGTLFADGNATLANTGALTNQGSLQAGNRLRAESLARLDNAGTLYAGSDLVLRTLGALANSNTLFAGGTLQLDAASLENGGTLRSAGVQAVVTTGNAANSGTAYAGGASSWQIGGQLISTGTLAAQGDLGIAAASLAASGLLGAGVQDDGSLAGSGGLTVATTGRLAATGQNLSAGTLLLTGNALDLHGASTRAGGDIALTAVGDIDLGRGDLATASALTVRTARLNNAGGTVQAGQLGILTGALDNRGGTLLQTGRAASALTVTGALDNAGGRLASNADDLTLHAGTLGNAGGAIEHAGTGSARFIVDGVVDNTGGRLLGNGGLDITAGGALTNARGTLSAARDAILHLGALDNADGTVIAQTLTLLVQGDIANSGGTLQAGQALSLSATNLLNGHGQVKALDGALGLSLTQTVSNAAGGFIGGNAAVTIGAGALANAGQIYAGGDLALSSQGSLANTGALQAMGSAAIGAGAIDNRGGRIEAGSGKTDAALAVTAASLDNTSGRIANAATGATTVNVAGTLTNTAGTLGGQGTVTVSAASIGNTGAATLVAGNDLNLFTGYIDNSNGTLYAARHLAWSNGAATLLNRQGHLGAGGNASLIINTLDNTGGETAANGDVGLTLGSLIGSGRVIAGNDLALRVAGDYTHLAGNTLKANRHFRFDLGGRFVNAAGAVLDAVQDLTVNAAAIDNAGWINSAHTTLNASGDLTNAGRIEGNLLEVRATSVLNTGTLMGDTILVHAANLTNGADLGTTVDNPLYQSALIAATQRIGLYVTGTLLNRDAQIFTLGDLTIAANEGFARSLAIVNRSGSIEADGNMVLAATQITNERRVLETERHVLDATEQAANTTVGAPWVRYREDDPDPLHHPPYVLPEQMISAEELALAHAYCAGNHQDDYRCVGYDYGDFVNGRPISFNAVTTRIVTAVTRLKRASAEGRIVAGGDIVLSGSVLNDSSTIAAGRNLSINGQGGGLADGTQVMDGETVRNLAFVPTAEITDTTRYGVQYQYLKHTGDGHTWIWDGFEIYRTGSTTDTVDMSTPPIWITLDPGPGLAARISAGQALTIIGADITNTTVGADGKPVNAPGTLGQNGGASSVGGSGPGTVGHVSGGSTSASAGPIGPRPGAQTIGSPDAPAGTITLPTGGLFTTHPGTGAGYLIETDPRFATQSGFLGSDYLMTRLGFHGESLLKRLGDAFYETRLVLDQITSLTGRRYLDGNSDATAQYRALMDSGVAAAGKFDLAVGVALTTEQMASLTTDIVWMVSQEVNGESVLVPVVYLSAATASNVASGASLSGTTVALDASGTLTNGGTIKASKDATLKAGTLLNAGQVAATGNLSLSAAQDLLSTGTIQGGNVALVAGRDLTADGNLTATGDLGLEAGRDLGLNRVALTAGKDLTLAAGRDLTATASTLTAGGDAQLSAGRDLALNAIGHTQAVEGNIAKGESTTHEVTRLTTGGSAVLAAGRDLVSQGAELKAGNVLAVSAGQDITLDAVTDRTINQSNSIGHGIVHTQTMDETLRGSSLDGTLGVIVSAGRDLTTTAATITSDTGGIALAAGRDVNLNAGIETHTWEQTSKTKKSGTLSSKTTRTYDATDDRLAIGTLLSGDSVTVAAGRDLTTQAAQIGATNDVVLAAGNNLTIGTATSTHSETHDKTVTQSGLMSGGGFSVMLGHSKEKQGYEQIDTTPTGSLIGSTDGRVTLSAGNDVHITGSDILSQTGTAIVGKNVTIDAAVGTTDTRQTYKKQSAGITLGLSGGVVSAAEAAYGASKRGSQVKDDRLKALYAAQAAYAVSDGYQAATAAGTSGDAGVSLRIGIGASSASSETKTHDEAAYGSRIHSKGDIAIAATGGDLNIIGSQVDGTNVALAAANNINLLSQEELHSSKSTNRNGSGEIGFSIGSQTGFYVTASAGRGKGTGNGVTHAETTIGASDTLTLVSGNDTTIKGAQLTGNQVIAAIGGNLRIESEQDTDDYASKQQQVGGTFVYGYGGSASYNQDKINSHYTSVNEVSGISAGSGGFQIAVGGNTHLKGGVIASTADPSKNLLNTGSLTWENIRNEANYSASSVGLSGGYSSGKAGDDGAANPFGSEGYRASPGMLVPQKGHSSSETLAGVANGTIIVRDGPVDLSGLDRTPSLDSQALKGIFDEQKIRELQELGQVAGYVGFRAAGTLADNAGWLEGSPKRAILHAVVGAGVAALGGGNALDGLKGAAVSQGATMAMQQYLVSQGVEPGSPEFNSMMEMASAAMGAAAGGGVGAATALNGEKYNRQLHFKESDWIRANAKKYADQHSGMSTAQAEEALAQQAYRQVQSGAAGEWNADASNFLASAGREMWGDSAYPGETFLMFQATSFDQKKDPLIFANGQQADADFYVRNGIVPVYPEQALAWEKWRIDTTKKVAAEAGVTMVGSFASPALAAYAGAAGATSIQAFLAGRTGVGLIGGTANGLSQLITTGEIKPVPVASSILTGVLTAGKGPVVNIGLNAGAGGLNTWLDNTMYGKNESILVGAAKSGGASAIGYATGYAISASYNAALANNLNARINKPDWINIGSGISVPFKYAAPYVLSNVGAAIGQESASGFWDRFNLLNDKSSAK